MSDTEKQIYELEKVTDNPLYEGLATPGDNEASLVGRANRDKDFFPAVRSDWNWSLPYLKDIWKPLHVIGRVTPFNDYPCLNMFVPAFSQRAVDELRDVLEPNGELLPLDHDSGTFYAFQCHRIVEILDQPNCEAVWLGNSLPATAAMIEFFSVLEERTEGLSIFKMRELCNSMFVTEYFVQRVREAGLNGFEFVKVWPYPKGTSYKAEDAKRRRERGQKLLSPSGLKEVKAESLVIEFPLSEGKMTAAEKKAISRFQDELDAQLVIRSLDEVYFGSLEGRSTKKGKTRLVLSCPDCEALVKKLDPWLSTLQWHTQPSIYLRHGPWDDTAVQEIPLSKG